MAITPMFSWADWKFQCLKLSTTAQGPIHGTLSRHVSRVHKRLLKLVNFLGQNLHKPYHLSVKPEYNPSQVEYNPIVVP